MRGIEKRIERLERKTELANRCHIVMGAIGETKEEAIVRYCGEKGISGEEFDKGITVAILNS